MTDAIAEQLDSASACDTQAETEDGVLVSLLVATGLAALISWLSGHWQLLAISLCALSIQRLVFAAWLRELPHQLFLKELQAFLTRISASKSNVRDLRTKLLTSGLIAALFTLVLLSILAHSFELARFILFLVVYLSLGVALRSAVRSIWEKSAIHRQSHLVVSGLTLMLGLAVWLIAPAHAAVHPVFQTPVTHQPHNRPAIHVEIKDDTEFAGLDTAELYLSVQSSRFPSGVHLLLPLNREEFRGCQQRFIPLPFEVEEGDNLSFELIDDNELTSEQEQTILLACQGSGYCVRLGTAILAPEFDWVAGPTSNLTSEAVAAATVLTYRGSPFRNFGSGVFIVQSSKPTSPHAANSVHLLDRSRYCRASVKVYFPNQPLSNE